MSMPQVKTRRRQVLLIRNVDWHQYTQMLRFFAERPGYRLTYDRGALEIMSPLLAHDNTGYLLGRFVDELTVELQLPMKAGRSTTFRRRKRARGHADKSR
jgi:Uma2 family endonuclease